MITLLVTFSSFPPLSISFLRTTPELSSLVCFLSMCRSSSPQLDSRSPFYLLFAHRLGSPRFDSQPPFRLLSVHGLGSSWLDSCSPLCVVSPWFLVWSSSACTNVLQVWQGLISKIEKSSNLPSSNFLFNFLCKQHDFFFNFDGVFFDK
jgi:hypothetical protein